MGLFHCSTHVCVSCVNHKKNEGHATWSLRYLGHAVRKFIDLRYCTNERPACELQSTAGKLIADPKKKSTSKAVNSISGGQQWQLTRNSSVNSGISSPSTADSPGHDANLLIKISRFGLNHQRSTRVALYIFRNKQNSSTGRPHCPPRQQEPRISSKYRPEIK